METDWSIEARKMAHFLKTTFKDQTRGILGGPLGKCTVIFGLDGYDEDERARLEVALIERGLKQRGLTLLGFGKDPMGGLAWALLVDVAPDVQETIQDLYELLWESCRSAFPGLVADDYELDSLAAENDLEIIHWEAVMGLPQARSVRVVYPPRFRMDREIGSWVLEPTEVFPEVLTIVR
jgi:hypothetical protein